MNATTKDILAQAFSNLNVSALEQIASHCEFNAHLALKYSETTAEKIAFIQSTEQTTLSQLAAYCRAAIAIATTE